MIAPEKNYRCSEDYLQEGFSKIPGQYKISFIVFGLRKCHIRRRKEKEKKKGRQALKPIGNAPITSFKH